MTADGITLNKFLADRGVASRRRSAQLVKDGRVRVNGEEVREPGTRINPLTDQVFLDGRRLPECPSNHRTILLYKPRDYVCSTVGQRSRTVYELIPGIEERLVPAGRLDKESEGLLVMSNDGELIQRITHPRFDHRKVYRVTISGPIHAKAVERLTAPLVIDGYRTCPAEVKVLKKGGVPEYTILEFALNEGRNQQIRRLCQKAGLRVHRLVRVAIGSLTVGKLEPGEWRDLRPGHHGL